MTARAKSSLLSLKSGLILTTALLSFVFTPVRAWDEDDPEEDTRSFDESSISTYAPDNPEWTPPQDYQEPPTTHGPSEVSSESTDGGIALAGVLIVVALVVICMVGIIAGIVACCCCCFKQKGQSPPPPSSSWQQGPVVHADNNPVYKNAQGGVLTLPAASPVMQEAVAIVAEARIIEDDEENNNNYINSNINDDNDPENPHPVAPPEAAVVAMMESNGDKR